MTVYETMARRVVSDGLRALDDILREEVDVDGFTNAIMLGLKELLKKDAVKVYEPEELAEKLS